MQLHIPDGWRPHADERSDTDELDRDSYVNALVSIAVRCDAPMAVGIYGGWGVGKSTFMGLIRNKLRTLKYKTVWFDGWEHQFDEHPAAAMLQQMWSEFDMPWSEKFSSILETFATIVDEASVRALGLPIGINVRARNWVQARETVARRRFQLREWRLRLRDDIEAEIKMALQKEGETYKSDKIFFFIDDLDRCVGNAPVRMLEALKLYLNVKGCVFFIALDDDRIKQALVKDFGKDASSYLEKIIQIPFAIPPIPYECSERFVLGKLGRNARGCSSIISETLGDNPRRVKRFANRLLVSQEIGKTWSRYSVLHSCVLMLIESMNEELFSEIRKTPSLFCELCEKARNAADRSKLLERLDRASPVARQMSDMYLRDEEVRQYITLVDVARTPRGSQQSELKCVRPDMVVVNPGSYIMGSKVYSEEKEPHSVTIDYGFSVGKFPVTNEEYVLFIEDPKTPNKYPREFNNVLMSEERKRHPVVHVTWDDAIAYAKWLSRLTGDPYRLLTEAEWEYCCRAGISDEYSISEQNFTEVRYNKSQQQMPQTVEVERSGANPWDLFGMHGNVWDWVEDLWHSSYQHRPLPPTNGAAWTKGGDQNRRVIRGGSWENTRDQLRSAFRMFATRDGQNNNIGFRLALGPVPQESADGEEAEDTRSSKMSEDRRV